MGELYNILTASIFDCTIRAFKHRKENHKVYMINFTSTLALHLCTADSPGVQ